MYKSWDFKHRSSSESNNRKNNGVFLLWPPGRQLNITLEGFMCERDWQASIFKPVVASSSNSHAYSMWCAPRIIYSTLVEKDERFTLCTCRKSSLLSSPCILPLVVILLRVCLKEAGCSGWEGHIIASGCCCPLQRVTLTPCVH